MVSCRPTFLEYLTRCTFSLSSKHLYHSCGCPPVSLRVGRPHKCHFVHSHISVSDLHVPPCGTFLTIIEAGFCSVQYVSMFILLPLMPFRRNWWLHHVVYRKVDIDLIGKVCSGLEDRKETEPSYLFLPHF